MSPRRDGASQLRLGLILSKSWGQVMTWAEPGDLIARMSDSLRDLAPKGKDL